MNAKRDRGMCRRGTVGGRWGVQRLSAGGFSVLVLTTLLVVLTQPDLTQPALAQTPDRANEAGLRPMTFPDWEEARSQTDLFLVSLEEGLTSTRRLTFTMSKDEGTPLWSPESDYFLFTSNRDAPANSPNQRQLYLMRPDGGEARRVTEASAGISNYSFSPDGKWLVYRSGRSADQQLYLIPSAALEGSILSGPGHEPIEPRQLTDRPGGVTRWEWAPGSERIYFVGPDSVDTAERLRREKGFTVEIENMETPLESLWALELESGEAIRRFSPDSRLIAFSAPDDLTRYSMSNRRIYLRPVAARGEPFQKLGSSFDGDLSIGFWSEDSRKIYFNAGIRVTRQLMELDLGTDEVRQLTSERAALAVSRDEDSGVILISYSDPKTPPTLFTTPTLTDIGDRGSWRQLIDPNPQVRGFALGEEEEVTWRGRDGKEVSGVLVKPVGYQPGKRYPLIIAGVDHLIEEGIVDPDQMGVLGWSAGGHWSNWILVSTDRFKAISSGAGTSNWISMYAQSDVQRNRQYYLGDELPYYDFEPYWRQSPLRYIANARTPTMIHVVEGDPRVPSPQSIELHMALKKLGVPTELFLYPGQSHGIPDPRNRYLKAVSEKAWMDYYVRGIGEKFSWRDVLESLETEAAKEESSRISIR